MTFFARKLGAEKLDLILLVCVAVFLYLLLFKLPFYPIYHDGDHLIFIDDADRMLQGEKIYRDFFQFTFPGAQVLYCILFFIFGTKYWVLGFTIILAGSLSFWSCLKISKSIIDGPYAYLPAIIFVFFGMRWFGIDGSHRAFSPLCVLLAIWLLLKSSSHLNLCLAGFFCALASFFTQQRGLTALLALAVFIFVDNFARGWKWKVYFRQSLTIGVSYLVSLSAMCIYFVTTAGLETFFWSTVTYPALYYKYFQHNNLGSYFVSIKMALSSDARIGEFLPVFFYSLLVPLSIVFFFLLYWRYRRRHEWSFWRGPTLLAIVGLFLLTSTTAPNVWRLFNISVPSLILFFWMLNYLDVFKTRKNAAAAVIAGTAFLVAIMLVIRFQARSDYIEIAAPRGHVKALDDGQNNRYLWLQTHTKPGDYILEVPYQDVYFLLGLKHASRYAQFLPTEYTRPEFVERTVDDLKKNKPRHIIWINSYNKPASDRDLGDNLGPLSDYIVSRYEPAGPIFPVTGDFYSEIQIWTMKIGAE